MIFTIKNCVIIKKIKDFSHIGTYMIKTSK